MVVGRFFYKKNIEFSKHLSLKCNIDFFPVKYRLKSENIFANGKQCLFMNLLLRFRNLKDQDNTITSNETFQN